MEKYMVKWKGQQTGPFTLNELMEKVSSREIKGIYEVFEGGEWKTIRVFLKGLPASASPLPPVERHPETESGVARPPQQGPPPPPPPKNSSPDRSEWARQPEVGWESDLVALRGAEPEMMRPRPAHDRVILVYSGFWMRLLASLFDHALTLFIPLWLICRFAASGATVTTAFDPFAVFRQLGFLGVLIVLLGTVLNWIYFAAMESSGTGGTLGKMMLGLVVTSEDGERITFQKATARYFGKVLSGLMAGAGFFLAAFTRRKQAFHDILTHCTVNIAVRESMLLEGNERLTNQPQYG